MRNSLVTIDYCRDLYSQYIYCQTNSLFFYYICSLLKSRRRVSFGRFSINHFG